jgi:putative membrane protein
MRSINKKNLRHNLGVILFMSCVAFVLIAARKAVPPASAAAEGGDSHFAMKAAAGGMSEVKLGQLAAEKGSNPAVKQFGQGMVTDHSKANEVLKSVAAQSNVKLPNAMGKEEADTYARLSKLSGKEFDQAYAKAMVKDHEQDVADFQKESTMGKNESMKDFAAKTLPTLQSYLEAAREMQKSVMSSSSGM